MADSRADQPPQLDVVETLRTELQSFASCLGGWGPRITGDLVLDPPGRPIGWWAEQSGILNVRLVLGNDRDGNVRGVVPLTLSAFDDGSRELRIGHGGGPEGFDLRPRDYDEFMTKIKSAAERALPDARLVIASPPRRAERFPGDGKIRTLLERLVPTPLEVARHKSRKPGGFVH
jgi:hypothetical protein